MGILFACAASPRSLLLPAPQALIQQLLVDISRHVPAFALELLAVQVLNEPTNLEMSTIGLRSLRAVVLSPPTFSRDKVHRVRMDRHLHHHIAASAACLLVLTRLM